MSPEAQSFLDNLTSEDAYWVGYLRADGYIACTKGHNNHVVAFGQVVEEPVQAYANYAQAKRSVRLGKTPTGGYPNSKPAYFIQSANRARIYVELGLKTENLPQAFFDSPHFWRGMVDGDGTVAIYNKKAVLQLVGTKFDMVKFTEFLESRGIVASVYPLHSIFRVIFSGNKALAAIRVLYENGASHLSYKRETAQRVMALTPSNHHRAARVS